jgi:hypothetical protein
MLALPAMVSALAAYASTLMKAIPRTSNRRDAEEARRALRFKAAPL